MLEPLSQRRLAGVHPDLVRVVTRAAEISEQPFRVTEGCRTPALQAQYVAQGRSWTLDSRHIPGRNGYGHAIDLVALTREPPGYSSDIGRMKMIAAAMRAAARECGVPIVWAANKRHGGDWSRQDDSPHFELPRGIYPPDRPVDDGGDRPIHPPDWHVAVAPAPEAADRPPVTVAAMDGMGGSTTGNTALGLGGGAGVPQLGMAVSDAAARATTPRELVLALLASPLFWTGLATICGAAYISLERRHHWLLTGR